MHRANKYRLHSPSCLDRQELRTRSSGVWYAPRPYSTPTEEESSTHRVRRLLKQVHLFINIFILYMIGMYKEDNTVQSMYSFRLS